MKKVKRIDASGAEVIIEVPDDYQLLDGEQFVEEDELQQLSREDRNALLNKIRSEEKAKHQSAIDRAKAEQLSLRQERDEMKTRLEAIEKQQREAELAGLKPDERQAALMREMTDQLRQANEEIQRTKSDAEARIRATELAAYRERVIRAYGNEIIVEMVYGDSEQALDESADRAHKQYIDMEASIRKRVELDLRRSTPATVPTTPVAAPAPNPAQPHPVATAMPAGFPTASRAEPVADASATPIDLRDLTSEEAVRSGRYSGELRHQVLSNLKRQGGGGSLHLGSTPRHLVNAQPAMVEMPGGVQQPQGHPTSAPVNPRVQQPAAAPQTPGTDARSLAAAAVARTHAGTNPVISQNPGAQSALQAAQATGTTPTVAFAQRWSPTPG